MAADGARTWILTGSPENCAATAGHDFTVIGCKQRPRNQAPTAERGDRLMLYLTRVMRFAAAVRITGELYEGPSGLGPLTLRDPPDRRPAEHGQLAFQGRLGTVSDADAALPMERMRAAAGVSA